MRTHGIQKVIDEVLSKPWLPAVEAGREVPEARFEEDCVVSLVHESEGFSLTDIISGMLQVGIWRF